MVSFARRAVPSGANRRLLACGPTLSLSCQASVFRATALELHCQASSSVVRAVRI